MKRKFGLKLLALALCAGAVSAAQAYDGEWKRGRIYYRQVCTTCHTAELKKASRIVAMSFCEPRSW